MGGAAGAGRGSVCAEWGVGVQGIIYVLSNPAMPGLVKIGKTTQDDPQVRLDQLYNTSVPVPFTCEIAVKVADVTQCESVLHQAFVQSRVNPRREFFNLEAEDVIPLLSYLGEEDVTPSVKPEGDAADPIDVQSGENLRRQRRPNMDFHKMGIIDGSELRLYDPSGERSGIAVVVGPRRVSVDGEEMTISAATKRFLGADHTPRPGYSWTYQGRLLRGIYNETYDD